MADNTKMYAPCHCGSGKKYKFCCGAVDGTKSRVFTRSPISMLASVLAGNDSDLGRFTLPTKIKKR